MYQLRVPETDSDLAEYFQFRWQMLRKPLNQPPGSEQDAWDTTAHHQMLVDDQNRVVGVGRLSISGDNEASIRFLAVSPELRGKGLGRLLIMNLESVSRQEGVNRVT